MNTDTEQQVGENDLSIEVMRLRQRITTLEDVEQRLDQQTQFLRDVYDGVPYVVFVYEVLDNGDFRAVRMNQTGSQLTGLPVEHWTGKTPEQIHPPDDAAAIRQRLTSCVAQGNPIHFEEELSFPSGKVWTQSIYSPIRDQTGRIYRVVGTAIDITERKQRNLAEIEKREAIIAQQSTTLNELSTPLLTISTQVMVMPLIGTIDSRRAQQIIDTLLTGVAEASATMVILDITGVAVVDTQVANTLIHAAQSVNLLGATVILTGIRPEIAQTLVGLGIDLGRIVTRSTLQAGIAYALQSRREPSSKASG